MYFYSFWIKLDGIRRLLITYAFLPKLMEHDPEFLGSYFELICRLRLCDFTPDTLAGDTLQQSDRQKGVYLLREPPGLLAPLLWGDAAPWRLFLLTENASCRRRPAGDNASGRYRFTSVSSEIVAHRTLEGRSTNLESLPHFKLFCLKLYLHTLIY